MASIVVNSTAAAEIAQRLPGALATTNTLGILAMIFGIVMQAANYIGMHLMKYGFASTLIINRKGHRNLRTERSQNNPTGLELYSRAFIAVL
jgi:hypothetical protein